MVIVHELSILYLGWKYLDFVFFNVSYVNYLQALQRNLEFEDELDEKFGGGTQNREIGNEI